jgi:hypothetical protein
VALNGRKGGQEEFVFGFEGSQAVPASPSDKCKAFDLHEFKFNFYYVRELYLRCSLAKDRSESAACVSHRRYRAMTAT